MDKTVIEPEERSKIVPTMQDKATVLRTQAFQPESCQVMKVDEQGHRRYYFIHFLVIIFGTGSCIGVNALFAEIPLLVASAPEGAALPAYVVIVGSFGYTVPIIYGLCIRFAPQMTIKNNFVWISGVFILATSANGFLVGFYDTTTIVNGSEHSTVLLVLFFITANAAGARNVLLLPYLRNVGESFITSFFIGEGLSGFIPSIVALIQGVGGNPICPNNSTNSTHLVQPPNFPPNDFFLFVTCFVALSTLAFFVMEYVIHAKSRSNYDAQFRYDRVSTGNQRSSKELSDERSAGTTHETEMVEGGNLKPTTSAVPPGQSISKRDSIYLHLMMFLVCLVAHGYLNTVQAYSSRPYGNSAHNLVVNLSQLAATAAFALGFWMPPLGIRGIARVMVLAGVGSVYVSWLALTSPTPLWHDTTYGIVVLVSVWVVSLSLVACAKLAITAVFYRDSDNEYGLYVVGLSNLIGTICGSTATFFLFNFTTLFTPYTACEIVE